MKLTAIFLFAFLSQISAHTMAQRITLYKQNASFREVFKAIEKQTDYRFVFSVDVIDPTDRVSIQVQNADLETVLHQFFDTRKIKYKIIDKSIVLQHHKVAEISVVRLNQNRKVRGKVTDENNEPLAGVAVKLKGSNLGTVTNHEGAFSLNLPENAVLIFSSIGFQNLELAVANKEVLNVQMKQSTTDLDVLVVVGFGTKKKANLTGAVTSVKMDEVLGDRPLSDGAKALQGTIPGLDITYGTGQPGLATGINIRGFESINGGDPLILVNNIPMDINDVNPKDIESVTVLKDASSTSIYGARAAFGVILITTKGGAKNTPVRVNYSTTMGYNSPSTFPKKASPHDFVQALKDWGQTNFWTGENVETWLTYIDEYNANPSLYPSGTIVDEDTGFEYFVKENDIYGEFINTKGFNQLHNLSLSGGSQKNSYRISLGMTDEDGIVVGKKDTYKRYNVNMTLDSEISDKLSTNFQVFYKNGLRLTPLSGNIASIYYSAINYHSAAPVGFTTVDGVEYPYKTPANEVLYGPARKNYEEITRLFGKATYKPVKKVDLNLEYTFEKRNAKTEDPSYGFDAVGVTNKVLTLYDVANSSYNQSYGDRNAFGLNAYGNYKETIGKHKMGLLAGINKETTISKAFSAAKKGLISTTVPGLKPAIGDATVNDSYTSHGVIGFFARIDYDFDNKYLFEINGRFDGSSRFPENHRFGFFPSAAAAWRVSNENFMQSLKPILSDFKIRASFGEIGNQVIKFPNGSYDNYPHIPEMEVQNASWIDPNTGLQATTLKPPLIVSETFSWERIRTLNLGANLSLFKSKLNADFDWYRRENNDMLDEGLALPAVLGTTAPKENVADLATQGWEINLTWRDKINEFSYSIGANLFDSKTKLRHITQNSGGLLSEKYYQGKIIGEIWGYTTDGYYTVDDFENLGTDLTGGTLKPGVVAIEGKNPNPGDTKFKDLDGDGIITDGNNTVSDPGDRSVIGNNSRRFQMGFNGSVAYKGFDLSFFIQGVLKRDIYLNHPVAFPYTFEFTTVYDHQLDYWTPTNTDAYFPRNYPNGGENYSSNIRTQTKYLQSGAFARLKNITLGYTLPAQLLTKWKVQKLRLFATGENLFNKDGLPDGIDAELNNLDNGGNYPFLKNYSFGLNLTF